MYKNVCLTLTPGNSNEIGSQDKQLTPDLFVHIDEATMEIPRAGSKPWHTVNRISPTFSWRRTRAAVETDEPICPNHQSRKCREQSWGAEKSPKKQVRKRERNNPPQER